MKHRADVQELPDQGRLRASQAPGRHLHPEFAEFDNRVLPAHMVPATATWKAHHIGRALVVAAATAAAIAVAPAAAYFWQLRTETRMQNLITVVLLAIGLCSLLTAIGPQRVVLRGSLLTLHGHRTETFDLADAMQGVELSGDPRKRGWTLALDRVDGSQLVLTRRDVDPVAVDVIVRHYRGIAERRAQQRWAMLGLAPTG